MSSSNLVRIAYAKEENYGVTPTGVKAVGGVGDLTFTAKKFGAPGSLITVEFAGGATAGAEVVTVSGTDILVQIADSVSTATQIMNAVNGNTAAAALVTASLSGPGANTQVEEGPNPLDQTLGEGEFYTARFVSEQYSGTPETTESAQIRTDRQSSGQVVTGLTVGGGHSFELAKETAIEDFMESAMFSEWSLGSLQTRALTINASAKTITAVAGSFVTDGIKKGDFIQLGGFTSALNNVPVMVVNVTDLVLTYVGPSTMVDGTGGTTTYRRGDKLEIGIDKKSLTIEKTFLDLSNKAIIYNGMIASDMELKVEYGSLISGSFTLSGNGYSAADAANEFATYDRYVVDPATTDSMNGSVDMPFVATDVAGSFATGSFCIQSLDIKLANNLTTQTCIGRAAPQDYNPGTANVAINMSSYLKDANWDFLARKMTQDSFGLGFIVKKGANWYAFFMPAIQVSFDDPASGGANQDISMDMSGQAKVGASGEKALTIYRL